MNIFEICRKQLNNCIFFIELEFSRIWQYFQKYSLRLCFVSIFLFTPHTLWEADSVETMWQAKWCQRCHWHSRRQRSMCMRMSMMWRSIAVCMTSQIRRLQIASHYGFGWVQSQFWLFIGSYAKWKRKEKKRVKNGVRKKFGTWFQKKRWWRMTKT